MREKGDQFSDFNFLCFFWWVTFQYSHLKNASKCTPRVHGSTHLITSQCSYSDSSLVNGMGANIPSPPTVLKMPVNIKSWGNHYLQSRETKTSCCSLLPSCLVHLQHLTCSHLEQTHQICPWISVSFAGPLRGKQWLGKYVACHFSSSFYSSNKYLWCECTQFVCIQNHVLHIVFFGFSVRV